MILISELETIKLFESLEIVSDLTDTDFDSFLIQHLPDGYYLTTAIFRDDLLVMESKTGPYNKATLAANFYH